MAENRTNKKKFTTKQQFERLMTLMEENKAIATNQPVFGSSVQENKDFWEEIAEDLNKLGPPVKSGTEWRKVWTDFKLVLKKKIAKFKNDAKKTGGGEPSVLNFSALEKRCEKLLSMATSAIPEGISFGSTEERMQPNVEIIDNVLLPRLSFSTFPSTSIDNFNGDGESTLTSAKKRKRRSNKGKMELIADQSKNQEEMIQYLKKLESSSYGRKKTADKILKVEEERLKIEKERLKLETEKMELYKEELEAKNEHRLKMERMMMAKLTLKEKILEAQLS